MFDHWKNFFHPQEENDHHPHAYRKLSAVALACVVGMVVILSALHAGYTQRSERFLSSVLPSVLVDMTNEDRQERGLNKLERNEELQKAARMKAQHMAEKGYFAHDSPDGVTPWKWFQKSGYKYRNAGENLAINFSDSGSVQQAWMNSKLHRKNILEDNFTEIGIGTAKGVYEGKETIFVVQMFGRPSYDELVERRQEEPTADEVAQADDSLQQTADSATSTATTTDELLAQAREGVETVQEDIENQVSQQVESRQTQQAESPKPKTRQPVAASAGTRKLANQAKAKRGGQSTQAGSSVRLAQKSRTGTFGTPTPAGKVQGEQGISLSPVAGTGIIAYLSSRPQLLFFAAMFTLVGLILLALLISVVVEAKKHHWRLAGYSLTAVVILIGVFCFVNNLLFVTPVVA